MKVISGTTAVIDPRLPPPPPVYPLPPTASRPPPPPRPAGGGATSSAFGSGSTDVMLRDSPLSWGRMINHSVTTNSTTSESATTAVMANMMQLQHAQQQAQAMQHGLGSRKLSSGFSDFAGIERVESEKFNPSALIGSPMATRSSDDTSVSASGATTAMMMMMMMRENGGGNMANASDGDGGNGPGVAPATFLLSVDSMASGGTKSISGTLNNNTTNTTTNNNNSSSTNNLPLVALPLTFRSILSYGHTNTERSSASLLDDQGPAPNPFFGGVYRPYDFGGATVMSSSGSFPRLSFNNNNSWTTVPYPVDTRVAEAAGLLYRPGPISDHWTISDQLGEGACSEVRLGRRKRPFNSGGAAATTTTALPTATASTTPGTITTTESATGSSPAGAGSTTSTPTTTAATSVADVAAIKIILKGAPDLFSKTGECREVEAFKIAGHHPNIVACYEVYEDERFIYLVLELLEGGDMLKRVTQTSLYPRYSENDAVEIIRGLVRGLAHLHALGIAHRDIKPENILFSSGSSTSSNSNSNISADGLLSSSSAVPQRHHPHHHIHPHHHHHHHPHHHNGYQDHYDLPVLKLTDFGIAHTQALRLDARDMVGTPLYVAPEVLLRTPYGCKADMWSLGVIVHILLTGVPPFDHEDVVQLVNMVKYDDVRFDDPEWDTVSDAGKNFVRSLLKRNVGRRLSADNALVHPWLAPRQPPPFPPPPSPLVTPAATGTNTANTSIKTPTPSASSSLASPATTPGGGGGMLSSSPSSSSSNNTAAVSNPLFSVSVNPLTVTVQSSSSSPSSALIAIETHSAKKARNRAFFKSVQDNITSFAERNARKRIIERKQSENNLQLAKLVSLSERNLCISESFVSHDAIPSAPATISGVAHQQRLSDMLPALPQQAAATTARQQHALDREKERERRRKEEEEHERELDKYQYVQEIPYRPNQPQPQPYLHPPIQHHHPIHQYSTEQQIHPVVGEGGATAPAPQAPSVTPIQLGANPGAVGSSEAYATGSTTPSLAGVANSPLGSRQQNKATPSKINTSNNTQAKHPKTPHDVHSSLQISGGSPTGPAHRDRSASPVAGPAVHANLAGTRSPKTLGLRERKARRRGASLDALPFGFGRRQASNTEGDELISESEQTEQKTRLFRGRCRLRTTNNDKVPSTLTTIARTTKASSNTTPAASANNVSSSPFQHAVDTANEGKPLSDAASLKNGVNTAVTETDNSSNSNNEHERTARRTAKSSSSRSRSTSQTPVQEHKEREGYQVAVKREKQEYFDSTENVESAARRRAGTTDCVTLISSPLRNKKGHRHSKTAPPVPVTGFNNTSTTGTGTAAAARTPTTTAILSQSHSRQQSHEGVHFEEAILGAIDKEREQQRLKHKRLENQAEFKRRQSNAASSTTTTTTTTTVTCKQRHSMDLPFSTPGATTADPGSSNGTFIIRSGYGPGSSGDTISGCGSESVERFSSRNLTSDEDEAEFSDDGFVRHRVGARTLTEDGDHTINDVTRRRQTLLQQQQQQPHNAARKERRRNRNNNIYINNENTSNSNSNSKRDQTEFGSVRSDNKHRNTSDRPTSNLGISNSPSFGCTASKPGTGAETGTGERLTINPNGKGGRRAVTDDDEYDDDMYEFDDREFSRNHHQHHQYNDRQNYDDDYDDDGRRQKAKSDVMSIRPRGHAVHRMRVSFDDEVDGRDHDDYLGRFVVGAGGNKLTLNDGDGDDEHNGTPRNRNNNAHNLTNNHHKASGGLVPRSGTTGGGFGGLGWLRERRDADAQQDAHKVGRFKQERDQMRQRATTFGFAGRKKSVDGGSSSTMATNEKDKDKDSQSKDSLPSAFGMSKRVGMLRRHHRRHRSRGAVSS